MDENPLASFLNPSFLKSFSSSVPKMGICLRRTYGPFHLWDGMPISGKQQQQQQNTYTVYYTGLSRFFYFTPVCTRSVRQPSTTTDVKICIYQTSFLSISKHAKILSMLTKEGTKSSCQRMCFLNV